VISGKAREARLSQLAATADAGTARSIPSEATDESNNRRSVMGFLLTRSHVLQAFKLVE
jgi:hypothetical protein